jgi:hypothetical protein
VARAAPVPWAGAGLVPPAKTPVDPITRFPSTASTTAGRGTGLLRSEPETLAGLHFIAFVCLMLSKAYKLLEIGS